MKKFIITYMRFIIPGIFVLLSFVLYVSVSLFLIPALQYKTFNAGFKENENNIAQTLTDKALADLYSQNKVLNGKIEKLTSGGTYLLINTTNNTFQLYSKKMLVRDGICSTGSFAQLELDSTKSWTFETPKGVLSVKNKITNPVWKKPDWAFVEEGLPVPTANHHSRYEKGVLGDYALSLGNGYLIHGTLYQRLMGMPVTHGCVRMKDDDLEMVYNLMPVGAKVYIY